MTHTTPTVADDHVISLEYTLFLDNGDLVDTSEGQEPLMFIQGHGHIIAGLEKALYGMAINETSRVKVEAAEGYGERVPDNQQWIALELFEAEMELSEGLAVELLDEETEEVIDGYVAEIAADEVLIDFNHPLAGEKLIFDIRIVDVRPATPSEIAHDHVHVDSSDAKQ